MLQKLGVAYIFAISMIQQVVGESPKFRILAPQFICPKDEDTPVAKPDNTIITLQTAADADFDVGWTVRWSPLLGPSQRFTLLLWRAVRALEATLNAPQPEPYVYVIPNEQLLRGVNYVFNVTSVEANGDMGAAKSFHIDNTQGDQKLGMIDGQADLLSIVLLGGQVAYSDLKFVLEAQVTSCYPTQDYYFIWTVRSTITDDYVDNSNLTGSRLEVHPYSFKAGLHYDVNCQVIQSSTGNRITQTGLQVQVLHRGLEVYASVNTLLITMTHSFVVETTVLNHDHYNSQATFRWECTSADEPCDFFESQNSDSYFFASGLPKLGEYTVTVFVTVNNQSASANVTVIAVEPLLPVLQIAPMAQTLNEGTTVSLVANASNVAPGCSLTWYFATEDHLSADAESNGTCEDCQHGEALTDVLTIYSLEENFLNELSDFSNETEWRQVTAEMPAAAGRARFVARCGCSLVFDCDTKGAVYADIMFQLNQSPKPSGVMISPETGSALETVFRISTLAVVDPHTPLRYSFYCGLGTNDSLLLGSYVEHLAVETFLPFIDGGTEIWVEVCDARGACSTGDPKVAHITVGEGSTLETLIEDARGHIKRCELTFLQRVAVSAIITYSNADQPVLLSRFATALMTSLPTLDEHCVEENHHVYSTLLHWLASRGLDTSGFIY